MTFSLYWFIESCAVLTILVVVYSLPIDDDAVSFFLPFFSPLVCDSRNDSTPFSESKLRDWINSYSSFTKTFAFHLFLMFSLCRIIAGVIKFFLFGAVAKGTATPTILNVRIKTSSLVTFSPLFLLSFTEISSAFPREAIRVKNTLRGERK